MPSDTFKCANCPYAIDATGLNKIQLEALRRWAKTCPKCGHMTRWIEQASLLETPKPITTNGGSRNAKAKKRSNKSNHKQAPESWSH